MKRIILPILLLLNIISQGQIYLKASLSGSEEVPSTASAGSGIVIVRYNTTTKYLELTGDYQNLTAAVTASHIHSPAAVGSNGPVIISLNNTGGTTGILRGTATLTPAQESDMLAGLMYVNVHTTSFPGGELRGQLTTTTSGQTDYLTGRIQGAQEVPPNGSAAKGSVIILSDKTTGTIYLTGNFSGLSASATAAHIHTGAAGSNGGVIIGLSCSPATVGTIHVTTAISPANQSILAGGGCYVNIHNSIFPGGEIRGQVITESVMVYLKASLQGAQEVPANASTALGTVIVKYNTSTKFLDLTGDYQNLSATITASHIHSPGAAGTNAPVLISLNNTGGTSGVLSGTATLTPAQESDMLAGLMYVNVHNGNFPGGELRGQLSSTTSGNQTFYLTGVLAGTQEVPSNASAATGNVSVLLDYITKQVYLTGSFNNLSANASAAHIHSGSAGTNGSVVVPLTATAGASGTVTGSATVSNTFADQLINGLAYVNIHNASFPGGEIRAQLGNQVLPVVLTYFNGYKQNNKIALLWESAQELNLRQYEIEEEDQATGSWINKAVISSRNSNSVVNYNFVDVPLSMTRNYVLYRLKMVDVDGRFSYSPVIKINFKVSKAELFITVNPILNDQLKYSLTGLTSNSKVDISIIDYYGRTVLRTFGFSLQNNNIGIASLAKGMYRLVMQVEGIILEQPFMK